MYIYCIYLYINGAGVGVVEAAPVMREELMHAIDRIKELFFLFLCDALVWTDSGHLDISTSRHLDSVLRATPTGSPGIFQVLQR